MTLINSIIDYSSTSSGSSSSNVSKVSARFSGVNVSSSSSSVNSYMNINNDGENDFQDFFDWMDDPEVANLTKIQMFKYFVIAKSKFIILIISNNHISILLLFKLALQLRNIE